MTRELNEMLKSRAVAERVVAKYRGKKLPGKLQTLGCRAELSLQSSGC
jgi:hypothetical protein